MEQQGTRSVMQKAHILFVLQLSALCRNVFPNITLCN